ncbi:MAG: 3-deoxy-8-phosphooctulonate synthase [Deltaproteobacteria bacterium]|nr:MAG: 3-deoxy-8-phosphooctulonate synthase [Deltaproteobacteria bacterium]
MNSVQINKNITIGGPQSGLVLIAGPCVLESREGAFAIAKATAEICSRLGLPYIFKASFDKANRSSIDSYRGPGLEKGLEILAAVKDQLGLPVTTDIHTVEQIKAVAEVVDIIQIPAFLCRQTDLLTAAGRSGRVVNIKKGQFVAPGDMQQAVNKVASTGNHRILLTERGTTFGYNNLVVDFRSIPLMAASGCPVVFDATHSVQLPSAQGNSSGGDRDMIPVLAAAAVAVGVDALFMEVHPEPDKALCDGANSLALAELEPLLKRLLALSKV